MSPLLALVSPGRVPEARPLASPRGLRRRPCRLVHQIGGLRCHDRNLRRATQLPRRDALAADNMAEKRAAGHSASAESQVPNATTPTKHSQRRKCAPGFKHHHASCRNFPLSPFNPAPLGCSCEALPPVLPSTLVYWLPVFYLERLPTHRRRIVPLDSAIEQIYASNVPAYF